MLSHPVAASELDEKPRNSGNLDGLSQLSQLSQGSTEQTRQERDAWSAADWQAYYRKRARIAEFDGLPRSKAAAFAFDCSEFEWLNREFKPSPPGRCVVCGGAECPHNPLLPCGMRTHAWVHDGCWPAWRAGREAEAVAALAAMGIVAPPLESAKNSGESST